MEKRITLSLSVDQCKWLYTLLNCLEIAFCHFPQPQLKAIRGNLRYELERRKIDCD